MKFALLTIAFMIAFIGVAEAQVLRLNPPQKTHFLNEQLRDKERRSIMHGTQKFLPDRSKMHHISRPDPRKLNPGRSAERIKMKREETLTAVPVAPVRVQPNH